MQTKMRKLNGLGYECYGIDLRDFHARDSRLTRVGHWLMDYSIEIISVLGIILLAYMFGQLMMTTSTALQAFGEMVDEQQVLQEDAYQTEQVLKALIAQRQEENPHVDAVTGAELPPYWTAPEAVE